jgi:chromatin remodeling complex protein RSC6
VQRHERKNMVKNTSVTPAATPASEQTPAKVVAPKVAKVATGATKSDGAVTTPSKATAKTAKVAEPAATKTETPAVSATPAAAAAVGGGKAKKAAAPATPATPAAATPAAATPAAATTTTTTTTSGGSDTTSATPAAGGNKTKKTASKPKEAAPATPAVVPAATPAVGETPATATATAPVKRTRKVASTPAAAATAVSGASTGDSSDAAGGGSPVESPKVRVKPTKEILEAELVELISVIDAEIERRKLSDDKTKDVRFLSALAKRAKVIQAHTKRVIKGKRGSAAGATPNPKSANSGFNKAVQISDELAKFMNIDASTPVSRTTGASAIHKYVTDHGLQNPKDRRIIYPDAVINKLLRYTPVEGEVLHYHDIQRLMQHHFARATPATPAVAS